MIIYDYNFRIKYKVSSDNERNNMLSEFSKEHYPKSYAWAERRMQKISKEDADDIFQESLLSFHNHLLDKDGNNSENLLDLFYKIFINKLLKKKYF